MKTLKTPIVIILCDLLLLEDCSSSSQITGEERARLLSEADDTILITLNDGSEIEAEPHHYLEVMEPSGSSSVRCKRSDCLIVTSKGGAGIWCLGQVESKGDRSAFHGRIPFEDINRIETRKTDVAKTVALVAGIIVLAGVAAAVVIGEALSNSLWHQSR